MRYALVSDVHCNYPLLEQCVSDAIKKGVQGFIFLGDYVTDGYTGNMVVSFLKALSKQYPCEFIRGNREKFILEYHNSDSEYNKRFNRISLGYDSLSQETHLWLKNLPEERILHLGELTILLVHGDSFKHEDIKKNYLMLASKYSFDICLYGHTHELRNDDYYEKKFINPGTLSYPEGHDLSYCIIDINGKRIDVQYQMIMVNQELVQKHYLYLLKTGYFDENVIWSELLLNWLHDKFGYTKEFMRRLREISSGKNLSSVEYNQIVEDEYQKFVKEKNLFRIKDKY